MNSDYLRFACDLRVVDKDKRLVDLVPNAIQQSFLERDYADRCVILKARQQGFSTIINAMFARDFLLKPHTYNLVVADTRENAEGLLDRVKKLIDSWQERHGLKIDFSTDTKYHLRFDQMDCDYVVATAGSEAAGRSKTISNLHMSEAAFYSNMQKLLAGAGQAVIPSGRIILETTANGYNQFKTFWDDSKRGLTGFKPIFYRASDFYSPDFLEVKRRELGDKFTQEYPDTDTEAFLASGNRYFDTNALQDYLGMVRPTI